jgi:HSP20 family molecular chaperone IbpA
LSYVCSGHFGENLHFITLYYRKINCNFNYKIEKKNNENEKILSITVYVPGFSKEDLELNIKNNNSLLELSYKKGNETKRFHSFTLAQEYDVSKLEAECKNGLLTIKIPEKLQITKKIEIK